MIVRAVGDNLGVLVGQQLRSEFLMRSGGMFKAPGIWASRKGSDARVSTTVIPCFLSSFDFRSLVEIVLSILISLRMPFSMHETIDSVRRIQRRA
jgi:hypothetical protein